MHVGKRAKNAKARSGPLLLTKPVGYGSGQAEQGYRPAVSLISASTHYKADKSSLRFEPGHLRGLAPAGRLDIDSQGLLILTQDGRIARQLISDDSELDKENMVRVHGKNAGKGLAIHKHGLPMVGKHWRRP